MNRHKIRFFLLYNERVRIIKWVGEDSYQITFFFVNHIQEKNAMKETYLSMVLYKLVIFADLLTPIEYIIDIF